MKMQFHFPFAMLLFATSAWPQATVKSPDDALQISFSADGRQLTYAVSYHDKPVILNSALGLEIREQPILGNNVRIDSVRQGEVNETYSMPHGKSNPLRNVCRTLSISLKEISYPFREVMLEARAYNDGVAFRYIVPSQPALKEIRLSSEKTQFRLAKDGTTYPLILVGFQTAYEDGYQIMPLSGIHPDSLIGLPLLAEVPGTAWIAITEANIDNYAGMYLQHSSKDPRLLMSRLAPSLNDAGLVVRASAPMRSPWRVIMIGEEPGRLLESNLIVNLNPRSEIADTSWIKPGKAAWDWWSGTYAEGVDFKPGMNTATMEHYIDFASQAGLPYMLIDAGWAPKAKGPNYSGSDITRTNPEINLPEILEHARAKNVRVWLWAHWSDVERQIDQAFPLYEKWGIAGVKIDFMNRDDQWMVNFYRTVVRKAAEHHLMIDFHGAFKPDGLRRTWPNLVTREAVMGAEYNKWSARITPDHNVMLPFTRMLAGPMDYTPGGFDNVTKAAFEPRMLRPMVMTTRAHQLALYVVFESGLQMVSDYPEAYKGEKEFDFIRAVPTVWDETRVVNGRPGDYITVARRRGREWYVGSMTGSRANELEIGLEFLGRGEYMAQIYSDELDADKSPKHTVYEEKRVNASMLLHVKMVPGGGQAIRIRPMQVP